MKSIFISSTFQDMQEERDIIHNYVQPAINEFAKSYGEYIEFVDLRWGIDTLGLDEKTALEKVVNRCAESIEKCSPYMIMCLGERYGWIIPEGKYRNKSITEVEAEEGVLKNITSAAHTLCYFRKINYVEMSPKQREIYFDTRENQVRQQALKHKIIASSPRIHREYSMTWDNQENKLEGGIGFAMQMIADLKAMLADEWGEMVKQSVYEQEKANIKALLERKNSNTKIREIVLEKALDFVGKEEPGVLLLSGETGCGKTTAIANLFWELDNRGCNVIPFFANSSAFSESGDNMIEYFVYFMRGLNGIHEEWNILASIETVEGRYWWLQELRTQIQIYKENNNSKLVFLIDEPALIKKRVDDDNFWQWISIIEKMETDIIFTCSRENSHDVINLLKKISVLAEEFLIPGLSPYEIVKYFSYLIGEKELDSTILNRIKNKKCADNFLYLKLIYERLNMYDKWDYAAATRAGEGMAGIYRQQEKLVETIPDDLDGSWNFFARAVADRVGSPACMEALRIIAYAKVGFRKSDVKEILRSCGQKYSDDEFNRFIYYLSEYLFIRQDGRISFANSSFKQAISCYGECGKKIYLYVKKLSVDDIVYLDEMIYLLEKRRDYRTLFLFYVQVEKSKDESFIEAIVDRTIVCLNRSYNYWMEEKITEWVSAGKDCYDIFDIYTQFFLRVLKQNRYMDRKSVSEIIIKAIKEIIEKYALEDEELYYYYELILELNRYARVEEDEEYQDKLKKLVKPLYLELGDKAKEENKVLIFVENIQKSLLQKMKYNQIVPAMMGQILDNTIIKYIDILKSEEDMGVIYEDIFNKVVKMLGKKTFIENEWRDFESCCTYGVLMSGFSNDESLNMQTRVKYFKAAFDILERCEQLLEKYRDAVNWMEVSSLFFRDCMKIYCLASLNTILSKEKRIQSAVAILVIDSKLDRSKLGFDLSYCPKILKSLGVDTGKISFQYLAWSRWSDWSLQPIYATQLRQVKTKTAISTKKQKMLTGYKVITYKDQKKPIYEKVQVPMSINGKTVLKEFNMLKGYDTSQRKEPIFEWKEEKKQRNVYSTRIRGIRNKLEYSQELINEYLTECEQSNPRLIFKNYFN